MANLAGKNEAVLALKSPADTLFNKVRSQTDHLPTVSSDKIHQVEVHDGNWDSHGSVKLWTYTCEGKKETMKERVEIDDANKTVTLVAVGGNIMEEMKSYSITLVFVPKPGGDAICRITIQYEKLDQNVPSPTRYLEFIKAVILDIDAHLLNNV